MKTAAASVINASASAPPMWNRMRKTREFLRKLSLKAEKNWGQNRGAKRRVRSRDEDMAVPVVGSCGRPECLPRQVPAAYRREGAKRRQFGQKDNRPPSIGRRPETQAKVWFGASRSKSSGLPDWGRRA